MKVTGEKKVKWEKSDCLWRRKWGKKISCHITWEGKFNPLTVTRAYSNILYHVTRQYFQWFRLSDISALLKESLPHFIALCFEISVVHAVQNAPRAFLEIIFLWRGISLYICEEWLFKVAHAAELGEPCLASRCLDWSTSALTWCKQQKPPCSWVKLSRIGVALENQNSPVRQRCWGGLEPG